MKKKKEEKSKYADSPVYWFVLMELSRGKGEFKMAAHAKRELARLGIRVTYVQKSTLNKRNAK
jgi:hypothetical protein